MGRPLTGLEEITLFGSGIPKVGLFTSTHREEWENTWGRGVGNAEGGLLLGITSPMNIFSSLLDLLDRKNICMPFALPSTSVSFITIG